MWNNFKPEVQEQLNAGLNLDRAGWAELVEQVHKVLKAEELANTLVPLISGVVVTEQQVQTQVGRVQKALDQAKVVSPGKPPTCTHGGGAHNRPGAAARLQSRLGITFNSPGPSGSGEGAWRFLLSLRSLSLTSAQPPTIACLALQPLPRSLRSLPGSGRS